MTERIRTAVRVEGIVQGVGFRPFVYSLATSLGLGGLVGNDTGGVFAGVEGDAAAVRRFLVLLEQHAPPLARIERVTTSDLKLTGSAEFTIAPGDPAEAGPGARRNLRPRRPALWRGADDDVAGAQPEAVPAVAVIHQCLVAAHGRHPCSRSGPVRPR